MQTETLGALGEADRSWQLLWNGDLAAEKQEIGWNYHI